MADGQLQGHTCIAEASVEAAAVAAGACLPAIAARRTRFLTASDQVRTAC